MSDQEYAFLGAIVNDPESDDLRLVFADYLEDQGDPRAEFIRLQIERERLLPFTLGRAQLERHEHEMLAQFRVPWTKPLTDLGAQKCCFRRGFVETIQIDADAFLRNAGAILTAAPVRHIELVEFTDRLLELARCSYLSRLRGLHLSGDPISDEGAQALASSPHVETLTALTLCGAELSFNALSAVFSSPRLTQLKSLNLAGNPLWESDMRTVIDHSRLRHLSSLGLSCTFFDLAPMFASPSFPRLVHLDLCENELDQATAITSCSALSDLAELDLHSNLLDADELIELARSPHLHTLRNFDLSNNCLNAHGVLELAASSIVDGLTSLSLSFNRVGDAGTQALAASTRLSALRALYLRDSQIGSAGGLALAGSPHLSDLAHLDLRDNLLDEPTRAALQARLGQRVLLQPPQDS
jgi:uncharacterized protein (TIGR02996 family)